MTAREAILAIVESKFKVPYARICFVRSVNESELTCTVETLDTEATIEDVRLQAGEAVSGFVCIPKKDSAVLIMELARFEYAIILFSELESIKFLDGSYGGLVKVVDLVSRLNAIEDKVNNIISTYNSHTHTETGATTAPTSSTVSGSLESTQVSHIENPLVKHGCV